MLRINRLPAFGSPLDRRDAEWLGAEGARLARAVLATRHDPTATPLWPLPSLAAELGVASVHIKDEGQRLGLGSFKALGGAYAVVKLVIAAASQRLRARRRSSGAK